MKRNVLLSTYILFLILIAASQNNIAQTGKLSGRITDEANSEPLIGASVIIEGTKAGAATDIDGYYSILNLRPGTYSVRYQYIGYGQKVISNIRISADKTTTQDVQLSSTAVVSEAVEVVATRPVIEFNQTSSVKTVSSDEMEALPVQSLTDIINLQAGIVESGGEFHIRGGRGGEVQFQVEGVSINNPFSNKASLTLDRSILEEVSVVSGTFDAKYGQAMSGVINATLKSGQDRFAFSTEVYGGDYVPFDNSRYPNNKDYLPYTIQNYQLTISGPTYLPNTTFLLSGRRFFNNGFLYGERRFNPTDKNDLTGAVKPVGTGDNKKVSMAPYNEWSGQFKLTNNSINNITISYVGILNYLWGKVYNFAYRLNPEGENEWKTFSINHGIDFTHTLSSSMFYKISVRHNYFDSRSYKYESIYDPRYLEADYGRSISGYEFDAIVQGVDAGRNLQITDFVVSKIDFTWQVNKANFIEAGIEGQINKLKFGPPGQLVVQSDASGIVRLLPKEIDPENPAFKKVEQYFPVQGAAYLQDRIELGDLVVRAGLRFEFFDPRAYVPSNLQNPANTIVGVPGSTSLKAKPKYSFAPRLGFGFPLTDRSALHFSYGHFYQMPQYSALYENANYQVLKFLTGGATYQQDYLGNPDLGPEKTVQYEIGIKQALTDNLGIDLTFFYKDIRDLLGTEVLETYNFGLYARNTNVDYGSVSGVTLSFTQRPIGNFAASIDYSLLFANGNSSDPDETANRSLGGQDPRPRDIPFTWDQRHTLNLTAVYQFPNNLSLSTIIRYASGQPYTPELGVGFMSEEEQNSGRKPSFATVDLRAEKYIDLGLTDLSIFVRVFNLFNQYFQNGFVYSDTGDPDKSLKIRPGEPLDPNRYSAPRRIEFGISFRSK